MSGEWCRWYRLTLRYHYDRLSTTYIVLLFVMYYHRLFNYPPSSNLQTSDKINKSNLISWRYLLQNLTLGLPLCRDGDESPNSVQVPFDLNYVASQVISSKSLRKRNGSESLASFNFKSQVTTCYISAAKYLRFIKRSNIEVLLSIVSPINFPLPIPFKLKQMFATYQDAIQRAHVSILPFKDYVCGKFSFFAPNINKGAPLRSDRHILFFS